MDVGCVSAEDGQDALRMLQGGEKFDLMLCDVAMPGMNGLECVEMARLGGMLGRTRVVMVATERDHAAIGRMAAEATLMKPFTEQKVRETMALCGLE